MTESEKELALLFLAIIQTAVESQKEIIKLKLKVLGLTTSQAKRIMLCESELMQAIVLASADIKKEKRINRIAAILQEWNKFRTHKKKWDDGYKNIEARIRKDA